MFSENLSAAALGGLASALRYTKNGWIYFLQVFISSACLAYFVGPEVVKLIKEYFGFAVGFGAVYFLTAYMGSEILDKATNIIKAIQVTKKWK